MQPLSSASTAPGNRTSAQVLGVWWKCLKWPLDTEQYNTYWRWPGKMENTEDLQVRFLVTETIPDCSSLRSIIWVYYEAWELLETDLSVDCA